MNYSVEWTELAESELAAVWLSVPDQADLSMISFLVDRTLGMTPFHIGIPCRSSVHRILKVVPLGLYYDIVEDDKKVIVQSCWLIS